MSLSSCHTPWHIIPLWRISTRCFCFFFFSSRRRHTRCSRDWSSDVCSSDLCKTQGYLGYFGASATSVTAALYNTRGIKLAGGLNAFPWWVDDAPVKNFRDAMTDRKSVV